MLPQLFSNTKPVCIYYNKKSLDFYRYDAQRSIWDDGVSNNIHSWKSKLLLLDLWCSRFGVYMDLHLLLQVYLQSLLKGKDSTFLLQDIREFDHNYLRATQSGIKWLNCAMIQTLDWAEEVGMIDDEVIDPFELNWLSSYTKKFKKDFYGMLKGDRIDFRIVNIKTTVVRLRRTQSLGTTTYKCKSYDIPLKHQWEELLMEEFNKYLETNIHPLRNWDHDDLSFLSD